MAAPKAEIGPLRAYWTNGLAIVYGESLVVDLPQSLSHVDVFLALDDTGAYRFLVVGRRRKSPDFIHLVVIDVSLLGHLNERLSADLQSAAAMRHAIKASVARS